MLVPPFTHSYSILGKARKGLDQQCVFPNQTLRHDMMKGYDLGGASGHIKAITLFPFAHQRKICTQSLLGQHALCMLGRTLQQLRHAHYIVYLLFWVTVQYSTFGVLQIIITVDSNKHDVAVLLLHDLCQLRSLERARNSANKDCFARVQRSRLVHHMLAVHYVPWPDLNLQTHHDHMNYSWMITAYML